MNLKNMIVRRRPSVETRPLTAPLGDAEVNDAVGGSSDAQHGHPDMNRDVFLDSAKEARAHVPVPDRDTYQTRPVQTGGGARSLPVASTTRQSAPKIWDIAPAADPDMPELRRAALEALSNAKDAHAVQPTPEVAPPTSRPTSRERVKTRLLGFHSASTENDAFEAEAQEATAAIPFFPLGWLVLIDGPGRGASYTITPGLSTIGRDCEQTIALDFGDASISRERHASVAYDEQDNCVYVGHGGKANIVRLNDKPLLSTEELKDGDLIKLGKTTLLYVAFCKDGFSWSQVTDEDGGEGPHG